MKAQQHRFRFTEKVLVGEIVRVREELPHVLGGVRISSGRGCVEGPVLARNSCGRWRLPDGQFQALVTGSFLASHLAVMLPEVTVMSSLEGGHTEVGTRRSAIKVARSFDE